MHENRKQARVLVIDNEPAVLRGVAAALERAGHIGYCCENAESALEVVRSRALDLIICDVNLGDISGRELCERIKEAPALKYVPMMFLSAAQMPDIIRRSDGLGGTYYLRKPFEPDVLVELVDSVLGAQCIEDGAVPDPETAVAL